MESVEIRQSLFENYLDVVERIRNSNLSQEDQENIKYIYKTMAYDYCATYADAITMERILQNYLNADRIGIAYQDMDEFREKKIAELYPFNED